MAKQRKDDFDDGPPPGADPGLVAPGRDPEKEALALRVAELEALLAAKSAPAAPFDAPAGQQGDYWLVKLQYVRDHVVKAADPANAWAVYCKEMHVLASEFRPEITPAGREDYRAAQARRYSQKPEEFRLPDDPA